MATVIRQAQAKINLGLRILGRRADGFHALRTVFQTISLSDQLEIQCEPAARTTVELTCPGRPDLESSENLAARAARDLLDQLGVTAQVAIKLEKSIPSGAGLGGGSSDAAAVLAALSAQLMPAADHALLLEVAARLGSDVPFFLTGGTALGVGRGEEVYPLRELPPHPVVVVMPDIEVSTPGAFKEYADAAPSKLTADSERRTISSFCAAVRASDGGGVFDLAGLIANDFEQVVFHQFPQLETIKQQLLAAGAPIALLSGSGSALFGIFESGGEAESAAQRFEAEGLRAISCRFVPRKS